MKNNYLTRLIIGLITYASISGAALAEPAKNDTYPFSFQVVNNTDLPLENISVVEGMYDEVRGSVKWQEKGHLSIPKLPQNSCNLRDDNNYEERCARSNLYAEGSSYFPRVEKWAHSLEPMDPKDGVGKTIGYKFNADPLERYFWGGYRENWAVSLTYGGVTYKTEGYERCTVAEGDAVADPKINGITTVFIEVLDKHDIVSPIERSMNNKSKYPDKLIARIRPPILSSGSEKCITPLIRQ